MKNPLNKRVLREVRTDFGKYLVIFLTLLLFIGLISGFLVAADSLIYAYNESFDKYNVEDGHFAVQDKLNRTQIKKLEELGISIYDISFTEERIDNGSEVRIFANRDEVNKASIMKGKLPNKANEIAIDRMFADNNKLKVGDHITSDTHEYEIVGLVALSDYSALFKDNGDTMFDSVVFGVGVVDEATFAEYDKGNITYTYAWKYDKAPKDKKEESDVAEDLMVDINSMVALEDFVPRYANQSIQFTGDDFGGDRVMMQVLLYVIIVILAFIFTITINDTIVKEADVIGTLRASGYTKSEMIRHYMAPPVFITIVAAVIGNIMGYTFFKDFVADMYYKSYSLPTYATRWNVRAFVETTIIPVLIMVLVTYLSLRSKLKFTPLQFLRKDLTKNKNKKAVKLPKNLSIFGRFRLRVIIQNIGNYIVLFIGIIFANFLLMFGLMFPEILDDYQKKLPDNMMCQYQYIMEVPISAMDEDHKLNSMLEMINYQREIETDNEDAEKFTAYSLEAKGVEGVIDEEISIYGVKDDSKYVHQKIKPHEVYISSAYADKFMYKVGDTFTLYEEYGDEEYEFTINGIYDYPSGMVIFMRQQDVNDMFDLGKSYFSGYFSDTEITDIDSQYISSVIDKEALTKVSRQLNKSMGGMMVIMDGLSVFIFLVVIYLLSKMIIEKNAQSISMTKILGYSGFEISRLYIVATSIVTVIFLLVSLPMLQGIMIWLWETILRSQMHGWFYVFVSNKVLMKMFGLGISTYMVVAALEFIKIKRIPMDIALKNED